MSALKKKWSLSKYQLFNPKQNLSDANVNLGSMSSIPGEWRTCESTQDSLEVTITENDHLLVINDSVVLESIFLPMCGGGMVCDKGPLQVFRKSSSVVLLCRRVGGSNDARLFKMSFCGGGLNRNLFQMKGHERAVEFVERIQKYCVNPISISTAKEKESLKPMVQQPFVPTALQSSSALVNNVITKIDDLPLAYEKFSLKENQQNSMSSKDLEEFVLLCLSDPSFSSYVNQVETVINNLVKK